MALPAGYNLDEKKQPTDDKPGKTLSIAQLKEQATKLRPLSARGTDKPTAKLLVHLRAPSATRKTTEESEHARLLKPAQPLSTVIQPWMTEPLLPQVKKLGDKLDDLLNPGFAKQMREERERKMQEFDTKHPIQAGVSAGVTNFANSMSTPENLTLMYAAPESKLLSAFFALQAASGSFKSVEEASAAYKAGNNKEAAQHVTEAILSAGVATAAGAHAYSGLPEGVRTALADEEGSLTFKSTDKDQPFFLKSEKLIGEKMKGPMPGEELHKMLLANGVKPEEMKWNGLDEFLKSKGSAKVTPEEMQKHIAENDVLIKEVQKGGMQHGRELKEPWEIYKLSDQNKAVYGVHKQNGLVATEGTTGYELQSLARFLDQHMDLYTVHEGPIPEAEEPKFGSHVLPGGSNYRELLLTLPEPKGAPKFDPSKLEIKRDRRSTTQGSTAIYYDGKLLGNYGDDPTRQPNGNYEQKPDTYWQGVAERNFQGGDPRNSIQPLGGGFRTNHWDEPNVLGHVRFNDRTGPNGEKLLHLEEVQSDWHQKGRRQGYRAEPRDVSGWSAEKQPSGRWSVSDENGVWQSNYSGNTAADAINLASESRPDSRVPDAPFKKEWPELLMKRMVRYAAQHGYDGVSWTPGEEQNARYDLSKQIDAIQYAPAEDGKFVVHVMKDGSTVQTKIASPEELADFVGKDVTEKIVKGEGESLRNAPNFHKLSGIDLKVGGEGMKGFYDKILPDIANKIGKKFGSKVGETKIPTSSSALGSQWSYDGPSFVAPALRGLGAKWIKEDSTVAQQAIAVADDMSLNGQLFHDAMVRNGSPALAEKLGGKLEISGPTEKTVPYIPITPEMRDAGPQSLFGMSGPDKPPPPPTIEQILPKSTKAVDRRSNLAERKRISDMSIEELRKELLTSDKTGIPNRRAFDDAEHQQASPAVAMSDADGLKALNDKFGYDAGDALLRAKAEALKAAGLDAYHDKGDEFLYRGESPESLKEKLDKAREILRNRVIEVKMKDGTTKRFKGADFSYGTGKDLAESESGLKQHKSAREQAGERARGELRGITEVGPETSAEHPGAPEQPGVEVEPAEPTKDTPSEEGYAYHATNRDRLDEIKNAGKLNTFKPDYGTDQNAWPDGSTNKRSYFTPKAGSAWQFAPEEGKPVLLRTNGESLKSEGHTGDLYSETPISAQKLEYLGSDQKWHPVVEPKAPAPKAKTSPIPLGANGKPVLSEGDIEYWGRYTNSLKFKTEDEAREWVFGKLQHEDESSSAAVFGKNGPEKNRLIADSMPLHKEGRLFKVGSKPKAEAVSKERLGAAKPEGETPNVDWHKQDLQDRGRQVSKETILRDYNDGKTAEVYQAYIDPEDMPDPQLAEAEDEGDDEGSLYDWESLRSTGRYRSVPPMKVRVKKNGKVEILDGNHRLTMWQERGFSSYPAWVIDERKGIKGLDEEE